MLLGLLVSKRSVIKLANFKRPSRLQLLAKEAVKENVDVVVFSPSGVNWADHTVSGLVFTIITKTWETGQTPFPDVIYDRAVFGSRETEKFLAKSVRKRLKKEFQIPFINTVNSFDKWKTHQALARYPDIKIFLPDTGLYGDPADLEQFLGQYQTVYLKPSGGTWGRNVFRVKQEQNGKYFFRYREKGINHQELLTLEEFHEKFIGGRLAGKSVIVQEGITLASVKGIPFDLRIRAQKNGVGKWEVVTKKIRMAAPGSVVTNTSNGGKAKKYDEFIPVVFPGAERRINREIDSLVYTACSLLEESFGRLGEIGFDMALDHSGKLWLLEANTKPANKSIVHKFFSNPFKYAKYLWEKQDVTAEIGSGGDC